VFVLACAWASALSLCISNIDLCVAEEFRHYEMLGANNVYCNPEPESSRLIIQKMKRKRERLWTLQTPALNV